MSKTYSVRTVALAGIVAAAMLAVASGSAHAAAWTWKTGVTGAWSTNTNWVGDVLPPDNYSADIILDGETANGSTANYNGSPVRLNTLTIGSGDTLQASVSTSLDLLNSFAVTPYVGTFNNAGTILATGAGVRLGYQIQSGKTMVNSGVIEAANGAETYLLNNVTYTNTGGTFRAVNGGLIHIRGNPVTINNGNLTVDATSQLTGYEDVQPKLTLNNVTSLNQGTWIFNMNTAVGSNRSKGVTVVGGSVTNSGSIKLYQQTPASIGDQTRETYVTMSGSAQLANSGTLDISNTSAGPGGVTGRHTAYLSLDSTCSFTTTGTSLISITQNSTSGENHRAYLSVGCTGFTNNGAINVSFVPASATTGSYAQLQATQNIANAGTITVDGVAASISMAGRTYTQTAGLTQLTHGGRLTATSVVINGGTLAGTGTVAAATSLASGGTLSPGTSAGTLYANGNVTFGNGSFYAWENGDLLDMTGGSGILAATGTWYVQPGVAPGDQYYVLARASTLDASLLTYGQVLPNPRGKGGSLSIQGNTLLLYVVPEPATLTAMALAGCLLLRRSRRSQQ